MMTRLLLSLLFCASVLATSLPAQAQQAPKFGVGIQMMGTTVDNNIGPGVRFRSSLPITQDISLGIGTGFTGYIFEGRDDSAYAVDPQSSLIVTLPGTGTERLYVLGGAGAYVPFGNLEEGVNSGPTVHLGIGKVWLLNESSFFLEFDPALYVGQETSEVIIPVRVGVIF
jgi:hypothetical protein